MPRARIDNLGRVGIVSDPPPFEIEDPAITFGLNVRAYHGRLTNFPGYSTYATPPIEPHGIFGLSSLLTQQLLWVQAGLAKVYLYDGNTHTNITRQTAAVDVDYNTNEYLDRWTGGVQNGLGFLCNGNDSPQQWDKVDPGTRLRDMVYDPQGTPGTDQTWGELGNKAFAMRAFQGTIFAMNLQRGAVELPATVQWCDFIPPGNTSPDWVPRTTNSAREKSLGDTLGAIIDAAPFRDDLILYKEDSVYRASLVGDANDPFRFDRLPERVAIINRNCVAVAEEYHGIMSKDDIYVFDGNIFRSILDKRMREFYNTNLFTERGFICFAAAFNTEKELWFCFPSQDEQGTVKYCDKAIVWNYADNTLSDTDLPGVRDMAEGSLGASPADTFDDPPDIAFNLDNLPFSGDPFQSNRDWLVGVHNSQLSAFGDGQTANGTPKLCQAERMGLVLQDPKTGIRSSDAIHRLKTVRPLMTSTGPVEISLGGQYSPNGAINWQPWRFFDPQLQSHVNFKGSGRFAGWRIRSEADIRWEMTGIEIEYERVRAK